MTDLAQLTGAEQARLIRSGDATAEQVLEATLERIGALNGRTNAFLTITAEAAREAARKADEAGRAGRWLGPLHGVPVALKDNFETRGVVTTAGSRVLESNVPEHDATVVERLRGAGAVIVGKTQLSEFAMGPSAFGDMHNPWDLERLSGASSGGSGAAVAAAMCPIAMGSDTGGSIRIPGSFSGVVGLKPTYGRISRYGLLTADWSLDHAGPLTRTAEDAAITLGVIAGRDARDPSSSRAAMPDYAAQLDGGVKGLRIGLPEQWFFDIVDAEIKAAALAAVDTLVALGASRHGVSTTLAEHSSDIGYTIQWAEMAAYHKDHMARSPEKYHPYLLMCLQAGSLISAADYLHAQRARRLMRDEFLRVFEQVDVLVTPTTPIAAPLLTAREHLINGKPAPARYAYDLAAFTFPFNQTGLPAITLPSGFNKAGLPMGVQIVGRPFEEATILRAAHAYQMQTDWHLRRPAF
jgi:Asp-tRNA(Asn)/Glu-tRNA(Gln) amidotransferase A subunit family amidase